MQNANGCGTAVATVTETGGVVTGAALKGVFWTGGSSRLTGQEDASTTYNAAGNPAYLMLGVGPSCTLFDTNRIGGMTTVPVYRHVKPDEYNRFIAVWNVGTYTADSIDEGAQPELVAIVDGALDTKEEELGEWDGSRNTI
jgi:hypothetical protein